MRRASVVGAGVFGAWIAHALHRRGWKVRLLEQHGPANGRASSGGETRIIRSGYGGLTLYARWAREAMAGWLDLERRTGERLFTRTGALFVGGNRDWLTGTKETLLAEGIPCEWLDGRELHRRFPQLDFADAAGAVFEPEAGVLFARRSVQALVRSMSEDGVELSARRVDPKKMIAEDDADALIFATGAWLPHLFPETLASAILPTRQEVFFFGPPPGDLRFSAAHLPAWIAFDEGIYGIPDLEQRGVKLAIDRHGPAADPETMERVVDQAVVSRMREVLRRRVPSLANAPLLETRVCQYENTTNGHLLIDRLPGQDRVWIAGGGSGHGFKHGPTIGRYLADVIEGRREPEPALALSGRPARQRAVY